MKHGPAWVLFEESYQTSSRKLLSIQSSRRTPGDIISFMEQLYVDRFASMAERLQYKKSRKTTICSPVADGHVIHCGHDPFFVGIRASQTDLREGVLEFTYRIIIRRSSEPLDFETKEKSQVLHVDA
jgi:hypothetical protein